MKKQHPGVGVIVLDAESRLTLGKRNAPFGEGCWCLPGGHPEFSESSGECARREILEKCGLEVKNVGVSNGVLKTEGLHHETIVVSAEHAKGTPTTIEKDKFVEVGWFDRTEGPFFELGGDVVEKFISEAKNGKRRS